MKKHASLCLLVFIAGMSAASAQSSIGIGTNSPNSKTSLHVDAPNGDKGFMMPRLTTTQRNAMAAGLGSSDNGLMVFDTNLNQIFSWSGTAWQSVSRLVLPYRDTNRVAIAGNPIFQLVNDYVGNDGGFMARFVNRNTDHIGAPLSALTNSTKFPSAAFYAEHSGTGDVAGAFRVDNAASPQSALYAETNGSGSGVSGNALGTGNSVRGVKQASATGNAVNGIHQGTSGHAGLFQITNAANSSGAVRIETLGSSQALEITSAGSAAAINVTKPSGSSGQGIYIDHQGDSGPVAQIRRTNPNGVGAAIIGYNNSNQNQSLAIYGNHEGTGDAAIVGRINNAANPWSAVFAETNGSGSALFASQLGTGRGLQIQVNNPANSAIAARSFTNGTGKAGLFTIFNAANSDTAFMAETNGTGVAIAAVQRGTNGAAGSFQITNAANNAAALRVATISNGVGLDVNSTGTAPAINVIKPAGSSGQGIYIDHQGTAGPVAQFRRANPAAQGAAVIGYNNSNNTLSPAVYGNHEGTGDAAVVGRINNTGNQWSAVYGETNGTGSAVYGRQIGTVGAAVYGMQEGTGRAGQFQISNPANTDAALRGFTNGTGRAGFFTINNAANASAAVYAQTNGTGSALMGGNSNNGFALALEAGGMKVTTAYLTGASSTISTRATAYLISGGGPYTLGFSLEEGEIIFFHNLTGSPVTINGIAIPANAGKTFITFAGILREM